ncbi:flagellin, partial [Phenylobacterium sp.]
MNSVNTNIGAMVALQNLNKTSSQLGEVQNRINTGLKVASAKDNGAIWAIAQNQRSESGALNSVKESLQRSISTVDVALSAGESISDTLLQMKEKALAASDTTLDAASRTALNDDFKALRDQLTKVVNNAEFNGANMIKATTPTTVAALASADGVNKITVAAQSLALGGANVTVT